MVLEVISQKSTKSHCGEFFFIMLLNYEVLATQNHDERYIVFFQISQLFKFKMFFIISTSKGKC